MLRDAIDVGWAILPHTGTAPLLSPPTSTRRVCVCVCYLSHAQPRRDPPSFRKRVKHVQVILSPIKSIPTCRIYLFPRKQHNPADVPWQLTPSMIALFDIAPKASKSCVYCCVCYRRKTVDGLTHGLLAPMIVRIFFTIRAARLMKASALAAAQDTQSLSATPSGVNHWCGALRRAKA